MLPHTVQHGATDKTTRTASAAHNVPVELQMNNQNTNHEPAHHIFLLHRNIWIFGANLAFAYEKKKFTKNCTKICRKKNKQKSNNKSAIRPRKQKQKVKLKKEKEK